MSVYLRGLLIISYNTKYFLYQEFAVKVFFFGLVFFTLVFSDKIAGKGLLWQSITLKTQKYLANLMVIPYVQVLNFPSILGTVGIIYVLTSLSEKINDF